MNPMPQPSRPPEVPRLLPDEPLPAWPFVPGQGPPPHAAPAGSSAFDPERWQTCRAYLRGLDFFNHGYYWEAHEQWESLWHGCGRKGPVADFLKGLIKLAAAGVKVREGKPAGVRHHAGRAAELFRKVGDAIPGNQLAGLALEELAAWADAVQRLPLATGIQEAAPVAPVFDFVLVPQPWVP